MIELVGAGKTFGNGKGVFDVDLRLEGGLTGFLGRNGSGKTTTMRLIMGLLEPDGGTVLVDGHDLWKYDHIYTLKRHLGFLPNDDYFFPRLTGRENLEYLSLLKTGDRDAYAALDRFIAELEVDEFIDDPFDSYSTGMKKKAQLVGALIGEPANILLDEPHNGLDVLANIALNRTLLKLRDEGRTVFVSSHLAEVFDTIGDNLVVIDHGRIVAQHPAPFQKKPVDLYLDAIGASGEASPPD
ncbi:MAG: ABC transporter ATP-binding protein [Spirochaetaceae bacterium]|nr:ABC transporter ATP-binding protein [Spirochaetaceae bacterium]